MNTQALQKPRTHKKSGHLIINLTGRNGQKITKFVKNLVGDHWVRPRNYGAPVTLKNLKYKEDCSVYNVIEQGAKYHKRRHLTHKEIKEIWTVIQDNKHNNRGTKRRLSEKYRVVPSDITMISKKQRYGGWIKDIDRAYRQNAVSAALENDPYKDKILESLYENRKVGNWHS